MQGSNGKTNEENRLIDTEKRGGEGEMYGESNMETYVTICKIDSQREFTVWLRKLKWALYQPRGMGWGGRWKGGSKERGYMYTYG